MKKARREPLIKKDDLAFPVTQMTVEPHWLDSERHLKWIRGETCWKCHKISQAHHLLNVPDKWSRYGMSITNPDCFTVPLCEHHHIWKLHKIGEKEWFAQNGIDDPFWLALSYAVRSDCLKIRDAANGIRKEIR